jgi:hypothetical protein
MTGEPRYDRNQLWERMRAFWLPGTQYRSLVHRNRYTVLGLDEEGRRCNFRYESGREDKWITLDDLYALYEELYRCGRLPRNHLRNPANSMRIVGRASWHAPGAAIYALLPHLDDKITVLQGGHLVVGGLGAPD